MAISVTCRNEGCGKRLRIKDEQAGKRIKCPACGEVQVVAAPPPPNPPPTQKVDPAPPMPETHPTAPAGQPETSQGNGGVARFARLLEKLNEKGAANFGHLLNRLGEAADPAGPKNLAFIIANMTEAQLANFARLLNAATPEMMGPIAKMVSSQPHAFLQEAQTAGQGTPGAAGFVSGCVTLVLVIVIVLKILACMGIIRLN